MKCLTKSEVKEWLSPLEVDITRGQLGLPRTKEIMVKIPKQDKRSLFQFARGLVNWVPRNEKRLILLEYWGPTYYEDMYNLFHCVRRGCGEQRPLIEAPGHVFEAQFGEIDPGASYDEPPQAEQLMAGLIFLILAFEDDWYCTMLDQKNTASVYLGDEYMTFNSNDEKKLQEAADIIKSFNLQVITSREQAWG